MPDHALSQVEDRLGTILAAYVPLSGINVIVGESLDVAIEDDAIPALIVSTTAYDFDVADESWQTHHKATIEVEAVAGTQPSGTISRANRNTLAHVLAAVAADRTLGIGLQDIQETDVAPTEPRGKDVDSASLQFRVEFFTSRDDWFTIV